MELASFDFDAAEPNANSSLQFRVTQRSTNVVDIDAQRMGRKKWIPTVVPGELVLNPDYSLLPEERDVLKYQAMWKLLGSKEEIQRYYENEGLFVNRVLVKSEIEFLNRNRYIYERFRDQPLGLAAISSAANTDESPAERYAIAKAWLEAHGIVPNNDATLLMKQYYGMMTCSIDEDIAKAFDPESTVKQVAAMGLPLKSHTENVQTFCKNSLHDDPYRPIAVSDYQHARFIFDTSEMEELAFMRGVGAIRYELVSPADLEADLKLLGLETAGTKRQQHKTLSRHVLDRMTRQFLTSWIKRFGFRLFATYVSPGPGPAQVPSERSPRRVEIDPQELPKLILFALLGQFSSGDVVCTKSPGVAVSLSPLSYMQEHFQSKGVVLSPSEQQDIFVLFPKMCFDKRARVGTGVRLTAELRLGVADRTTRMGLIDALLEDGVSATMKLTDQERPRVAKLLGIKPGEKFEQELRTLLEKYLRDFNGAYLKTWLEFHNPTDDQPPLPDDVESMLNLYNKINLCKHGWRSDSQSPVLPATDSLEIKDVMQKATWLSASDEDPDARPEIKANDPELVQACGNLAAQSPDTPDPLVAALEKREKIKRSTRAERVHAAFCLLDTLWMDFAEPSDTPQKKWLMGRAQDVMRILGQESETAGDDDKRYNDFRLWLEHMASVSILRKILEVRPRVAEQLTGNLTKTQLLQLLAKSNMERYKLVQLWAKNAHKGFLCWRTSSELLKKLDMLDVSTDTMSDKKQTYYFMNLLHMYLPDELVTKFLTEADRKEILREGKEITFNECYAFLCRRFGNPQTVALAIEYNRKLAAALIVKITDQSRTVDTPQCAASAVLKNPNVTQESKTVMLKVLENVHILKKESENKVEEYIVRPNESVKFVQTFEGPDANLPNLVNYFVENGETLLRVDEQDVV